VKAKAQRSSRTALKRRSRGGSAAEPVHPLVAIVDDDPDVCLAIERALHSVGVRTAIFTDPVVFLETTQAASYSCIVLDVRMPRMSGLEVQQVLNRQGLPASIVFVSGHGDIPMALSAVRAGAVQFLEKPWRDQVLLDAVNEAIGIHTQRRAAQSAHDALRARFAGLTPREREVAVEVAAGRSAAEIGERLGLSRRTVEMHRMRAMRRLEVHSSSELTRLIVEAQAAGLLQA
jgi:FixJ family two-component response regulator